MWNPHSQSCTSDIVTQGQQIREIQAQVPSENPTLGLALQWCPLAVTEDVWHILDVTPNSPADVAGLIPYSDYVVGSPEGSMRGDSGLAERIEDVCRCALCHNPPDPMS